MFNENNCLLSPRLFEHNLFESMDDEDKLGESTNFLMTKGGQVKVSNSIMIREVMFPALYPFKVKSVKKINDLYEVFLTSPDAFNYTDEHFNMLNFSIFEKETDISEFQSVLKLTNLRNFDEMLPLKQSEPDFYYEIYFYNLYHQNLLFINNNNVTKEVG